MGTDIEATWTDLGPMPTDATLEAQLDRVKYENNSPKADEAVWLQRLRANVERDSRAEIEFLSQLDRELKGE